MTLTLTMTFMFALTNFIISKGMMSKVTVTFVVGLT